MAAYRLTHPDDVVVDTVLRQVLAEHWKRPSAEVFLYFDGATLPARDQEPLALALLAAGHTVLSRSVKLHRPRGPACLRGACEGCLVRMDGLPNQMACQQPVRHGLEVETQNAFPSVKLDALRITDWFFPKGLDHHHLMVGQGRALNEAMQRIARKLSGVGTLPEKTALANSHGAEEIWDVLVVGAGVAGLAAARELALAGRKVLCVDETERAGGALLDWLALVDGVPGPWRADQLVKDALAAGVTLRTNHCIAAAYDQDSLLVGPTAHTVVRSAQRLLAVGCNEVLGCFPNSDLPGVYTARAVCRALRYGVVLARRWVALGLDGHGAPACEALRAAGAEVHCLPQESFTEASVEVLGSTGVTGVRVGTKTFPCEALLLGTHPVPQCELAGQLGLPVETDTAREAFVPRCDDDGSTEKASVFLVGSVRKQIKTFAEALEDGTRVARTMLAKGPRP